MLTLSKQPATTSTAKAEPVAAEKTAKATNQVESAPVCSEEAPAAVSEKVPTKEDEAESSKTSLKNPSAETAPKKPSIADEDEWEVVEDADLDANGKPLESEYILVGFGAVKPSK